MSHKTNLTSGIFLCFQDHRGDLAFTDARKHPNTKLFAGADEGSNQH